MNPITLPPSPKTRADLEKAGWQVQPINPGYVVLIKGKSTVGLWADGNHSIAATAPEWNEVAAILGIAPKGYRIIPEETAAAYLAARDTFFGPKERDDPEATMKNWTRLEDAEENLAVALGGTRLLPPRPAGDSGLSPSPPGELSDEELRVWSEVTSGEPGFHQVNPINQRKAAALHPDGQALLNMVRTGLDSYDTPRITAELKAFFAEDEADEPREEDKP